MKKDKNRGFTLIELVVVIVILAILIGVSVSGYSKYIGVARVNTDIQNVEEVKRILSTDFAIHEEIEKIIENSDSDITITITWSQTARKSSEIVLSGGEGASEAALKDEIKRAIDEFMSGQLPAPQARDTITVTIVGHKGGVINITDSITSP